MNSVVRTNTNS